MDQLLIPAVILFFLVWGVIGAAIGAGLIVAGGNMTRLLWPMNRYVSTRHAMKSLSIPHDVGQSVRRHRRLIGALFVAGAAFAVYGLVAWFNTPAIVAALGLPYPRAFVALILDCMRWSLIVLNGFALVVGLMLAFFPRALHSLETQANRWYSIRTLAVGGDRMHLPLDRLVAAHPRSAGVIIAVAAVVVAANAGALWSRIP